MTIAKSRFRTVTYQGKIYAMGGQFRRPKAVTRRRLSCSEAMATLEEVEAMLSRL